MGYWCINDDYKPQWVQDLIDRKLLIRNPTPISDCYTFYQTEMTTSPIYLYDGDGLCYCDNKIGVVYNLYFNFKKLKERIPVVKYYCDICKREILFREDFYNLKISKENIYNESINKDICEDCYSKIMNLIKNNDKD